MAKGLLLGNMRSLQEATSAHERKHAQWLIPNGFKAAPLRQQPQGYYLELVT